MASFQSYVTENATLGSFINARISERGMDTSVQISYSGTAGSSVVLIRTA